MHLRDNIEFSRSNKVIVTTEESSDTRDNKLTVGKTLTVQLPLSSRSSALSWLVRLSFQCGLHSEMLLRSSLCNSKSLLKFRVLSWWIPTSRHI